MKAVTLLAAAALGGLLAASGTNGEAQRSPQASAPPAPLSYTAPVAYRNLSVVFVKTNLAPKSSPYMTLAEALAAGVLTIREAQGGGEVQTLLVTNTGTRPVFLMAGEVLLGGKQDRCVARDTLVPAGAKGFPVHVYCVEQGRWQGAQAFTDVAKSLASSKVRRVAQEGAHRAAASPGRPNPRSGGSPAPQQAQMPGDAEVTGASAQSMVWSQVAAENRAFRARTETGTYRGVVNVEGSHTRSSVQPYLNALAGRMPKSGDVVGIVAAVNGRPIAADLFGDPRLFRKLLPRLLASYAAEAAQASSSGKGAPSFTTMDARAFVEAGLRAKTERSLVDKSIVLERRQGANVTVYRAAPAHVGSSGPGGALHLNILPN